MMRELLLILAAFLFVSPACAQYSTGYGTTRAPSVPPTYSHASSYHDNTRDYFFFLLPTPVIVQAAPVAPTVAATAPATVAAPTPSPTVTDSKSPATVIDLDRVSAALDSCVRCHGPDKHKGGIVLFNAAGAFEPKVSPKTIYDAVASDLMPQGGPPLSPQDKSLLKQWSTGATPNVAPATPNVAPAQRTTNDPVLQALQDISRRLTVLEKAKAPVPVVPPPMPPATDSRK